MVKEQLNILIQMASSDGMIAEKSCGLSELLQKQKA